MAHPLSKAAGRLAASLLVGGLIWSATGLAASAQTVSSDKILNALAPPVTRSLTAPKPSLSDSDQAFVDSLRHRTRSLSLDEADRVAAIAKEQPKINLEINFDYNSAAVTEKAEPQLTELGNALKSSRLENSIIVLSGHTDAKGGDDYNQKLSERRAEAVKKYLVEKFKISADNLSTVGYGKRDLKNKNEPFAAENRRVEIVNMGKTNQAAR